MGRIVIIYEKDVINDSSYLYYNSNEMVDLEIVLEQEGSTYFYKYRIEDTTVPSDFTRGEVFNPGQVINIGVVSSIRVDELDISGVNAIITNNTDLVVEIETEFDDKFIPRFNLVNESDKVTLRVK